MTARTAGRRAAAAGRTERVNTDERIRPTAHDDFLLGRPAMLSTVSLNAAVAITVSPTKCGLDRALRTCVRGALKARRTPRATEARTIRVSRVESSPETPDAFPTARTRRRKTIMRSPTRSRSGLMCLRPSGGDEVADICKP